MQDLNNIIFIPLNTFQYRFWDPMSSMRDDLDGVEIRLRADADSIEVAKIVTAVLNSTHHGVQDFTVTIPAALLAQQKRTQTIFTYVMVAIAAISLLVGGIGIMNIVLATVLERTQEIGIRRSIGARRVDIVRQFLTESVLISVGGGVLGIGVRLLPGVADRAHRRVEDHRHARLGDDRLRRLGGGRRGLRHLSGAEGVAHQPDRRAALRVIVGRAIRPAVTPSGVTSRAQPGHVGRAPWPPPALSRRFRPASAPGMPPERRPRARVPAPHKQLSDKSLLPAME